MKTMWFLCRLENYGKAASSGLSRAVFHGLCSKLEKSNSLYYTYLMIHLFSYYVPPFLIMC